MKKSIYIVLAFTFLLSCIEATKSEIKVPPISIAQKIAEAHGYAEWKNINEIAFTFNEKRNWTWQPKSNDVRLETPTDTVNYNRKHIDTSLVKVDRGFINDKFWLLIPFQLVWDKNITISNPTQVEAPVSKTTINKITITYPSTGGYTPGDAYDLYYDNNFIIREWGFRKGNEPKARIINTFENYQDFKGLKIALDHKRDNNKNVVTFSNVSVK